MNVEYPTDHEGEPYIERMLNEIGIEQFDRWYRIGGDAIYVSHEQYGELRVKTSDYGWFDIPIIELWDDYKNGKHVEPVSMRAVSNSEVVISRLTLATLADWADLDIGSMDDVPQDIIDAVDDAYDTLGHER